MSQPPRTCSPDDSLDVAARSMWEDDIGCVIVVDAHGAPIGVVTDRDACMAAYTKGRSLHDIPVRTAMAQVVYTCSPNESLRTALDTMQKHKLRRLPVVDAKGRAIGLLSISDLLRWQTKDEAELTARALAKIVEPREGRALVDRSSGALVAA